MRRMLLLVFATFPAIATVAADDTADRPARAGDHVIVRASVVGCPNFPGILGQHRVEVDSELQVLALEPVPTHLRTAGQIRDALLLQIASMRADGEAPASLRVEILRSEVEFRLMAQQIIDSFSYLVTDRCLRLRFDTPAFERNREMLIVRQPDIA